MFKLFNAVVVAAVVVGGAFFISVISIYIKLLLRRENYFINCL